MVRLLKNPEGGFTYIGLMVSVAIIGVTTAVVGMSLKTVSRIEKEKELIWIGHQFRQAIKFYINARPVPAGMTAAGAVPYPAELRDLIKDPKFANPRRYLRKIYIDPMTGKDDWVLIFDQNGRIKGVRSNSDRETIKRDNFSLEDEKLTDKTRYSEWEFVYDPNAPI